jgi:hypothetical protein
MQRKSGLYTVLLPGCCMSLLQPPPSSSSSYDQGQARTTITMMTTIWLFRITSSRETIIKKCNDTYYMQKSLGNVLKPLYYLKT